jgi:hypothetical protein
MAGEAAVGSSPGQALTGIRALEGLPEQFGQTVAVELDLHDDVSVRLGLKAHQRVVLAIKPLAHLPKLVAKSARATRTWTTRIAAPGKGAYYASVAGPIAGSFYGQRPQQRRGAARDVIVFA